jgi:hypothetical protein
MITKLDLGLENFAHVVQEEINKDIQTNGSSCSFCDFMRVKIKLSMAKNWKKEPLSDSFITRFICLLVKAYNILIVSNN